MPGEDGEVRETLHEERGGKEGNSAEHALRSQGERSRHRFHATRKEFARRYRSLHSDRLRVSLFFGAASVADAPFLDYRNLASSTSVDHCSWLYRRTTSRR